MLGFSVCFLPFAVYARPLRALIGNKKGLTVMTSVTLFFVLMMLSIGFYTESSLSFWKTASAISLPLVALTWLLFLLIRYLKINGLIKAGICTAILGIFSFFIDYFINMWLGNETSLPVFRPFTRKISTAGNVKWLILLSCTLAGIVLIVSGINKRKAEDTD